MKTKDLTLIALFAALMCCSAMISIPTPSMPVTLQTMTAYLSGLLLGRKRGAAAQALYVFIGLAGLPVFSNMQGGIGFIFRPGFGFVIGFIAAAFLVGTLQQRRVHMAIACFMGMLAIYAIGLPYMYIILNRTTGVTASWVLVNGMLIYLPGEAFKIAAAVYTGTVLPKHFKLIGKG